jgi:hypothetical protein
MSKAPDTPPDPPKRKRGRPKKRRPSVGEDGPSLVEEEEAVLARAEPAVVAARQVPKREHVNQRRHAVALLMENGVPLHKIYRAIAGKYGCSARTVRFDIEHIGRDARLILDGDGADGALAADAMVFSIMNRLQARAVDPEMPGSVRNAADQILLNILGFRATKKLQQVILAREAELKAEKIRFERAKADVAVATAEDINKGAGDITIVTRDLHAIPGEVKHAALPILEAQFEEEGGE